MIENTEEKKEQKNAESEYMGIGGLLLEMGRVFLLAVIIIIPVRVFLFQPFFVQGSSMQPNFEDGEYLVISEFGYKQTNIGWSNTKLFQVTPFQEFARQEVAVFRFPNNTEEFFIKRVIGLPGESVEIKRGKIIIYNTQYPEGFVLDESAYISVDVLTADMPKTTVASDQYFMMGDNRMFSYDSRVFGPVNKDKIIGKVLLRAWPAERFSLF